MISLTALQPQIVDVKIMGTGQPVELSVLPLSYIQWQNATLGLIPPKPRFKKMVQDVSKPPVEVPDPDNADYQRENVVYQNTIKMRRVALALAGAGMEELQGLSLDEQAELMKSLDAGILNALYLVLEGLATKRTGAWFRRESAKLPENSDGHLPTADVVSGTVAVAAGD